MESKKIAHLLYCPATGLGLYSGFRGNRWLRNRIQIFKQFVVPSLQAQTNKNFILWVSWRSEERYNKDVSALKRYLDERFNTIFTYSGIAFYDDKYPDGIARKRLIEALHGSMGAVINRIGECEEVLMTIQPSDDCYHKNMVEGLQTAFREIDIQAIGFTKGYVMNYLTGELAEWNPDTNPPFYTIRFPRETFIDPLKHAAYTSLKGDIGKYKQGTPLPSHEYVRDCLSYGTIAERGFLVGCHGHNISTTFNHPFTGKKFSTEEAQEILTNFGISASGRLILKVRLRRRLFLVLPQGLQKKLRYWLGERLYTKVYNFIHESFYKPA